MVIEEMTNDSTVRRKSYPVLGLRGVADNEARGPKANGATKTID